MWKKKTCWDHRLPAEFRIPGFCMSSPSLSPEILLRHETHRRMPTSTHLRISLWPINVNDLIPRPNIGQRLAQLVASTTSNRIKATIELGRVEPANGGSPDRFFLFAQRRRRRVHPERSCFKIGFVIWRWGKAQRRLGRSRARRVR